MINAVEKNPPDISKEKMYDSLFLNNSEKGQEAFREQMHEMTNIICETFRKENAPFTGKEPQTIEKEVEELFDFPSSNQDFTALLNELKAPLFKNNLQISHEKSLAHLQCPPLIPAIAAELAISVFNQSLDSWDQSPSATYLEEGMIKWLADQFGYSSNADGTFTSGGTQSNYTGLLLARDACCLRLWGQNVQKDGLPDEFHKLRILCSEEAHFTVQKSAVQLGLGEKAVIKVKTDKHHRMSVSHLQYQLAELKAQHLVPFALVGTCGTTDFGSIDPLDELAAIAHEEDLWFHVDAAFGGALILSKSHKSKLKGICYADSLTVDFHKLFYQPISCGAFLVKNKESFRFLIQHADYLNPLEDVEEGIPNLVNKSILTSRRLDAFKLFLSLKTIGTNLFGEMIDHTFILAQTTAEYLSSQDDIKVENLSPELNTVIFRYEPQDFSTDRCKLNRKIQQELLYEGRAAIAKTSVNGQTFLKFTILNPRTKMKHIQEIVDDIRTLGRKWREHT
ncbi:aspartate aminotransferase family protein [Alkalihalobacillus hwajinpoensis]|uniref:pyridoxal phosphate-dependent decarboxylase family protein n=1 Tax=Guptibacillus hwajinpoensis TaxID=208199 RepID=UPI001883607C|nr:aspartate aminotransferase family protein [Pseudalkalibacillus hwajinpoensis]MBF0708771.1 aspartate aminotransferase family protein [Pseudalkalibacillus hwajinpoensis]